MTFRLPDDELAPVIVAPAWPEAGSPCWYTADRKVYRARVAVVRLVSHEARYGADVVIEDEGRPDRTINAVGLDTLSQRLPP